MIDALKSYLQLASGMAEVSAAKAKEAAGAIVSQGPSAATAGLSADQISAQLQSVAEDLLEQSKTNREILVGLVKTEVDRAVGRMGFVREEELAAVRRHVQRLESQLGSRSGQAVEAAGTAVTAAKTAANAAAGTARTAGRTAANAARSAPKLATPTPGEAAPVAKKPAAKKAAPKKTTAKKAPAKKPAAKKAPAKKPAARKSAVKKTTASKAVR